MHSWECNWYMMGKVNEVLPISLQITAHWTLRQKKGDLSVKKIQNPLKIHREQPLQDIAKFTTFEDSGAEGHIKFTTFEDSGTE